MCISLAVPSKPRCRQNPSRIKTPVLSKPRSHHACARKLGRDTHLQPRIIGALRNVPDPAASRTMAGAAAPNVLRLYRDLLRAAARYPSVRRASYVDALKAEFRDGRTSVGSDLDYRLKLAMMELRRLNVYSPSRDSVSPTRMTRERDFTIQL